MFYSLVAEDKKKGKERKEEEEEIQKLLKRLIYTR